MKSNSHKVVVSWGGIPHLHWVAEAVFSWGKFGEFAERYSISKEELFGKMSRKFYLEHFKPINSVKIILTDEEPFGDNLLDYYRTWFTSL